MTTAPEHALRVLRAKAFAIEAHGDQRYGTEPYETHLQDVVSVLLEFGFTDPDLLAAAWCHDVLEDTGVTAGQLDYVLSSQATKMVLAVTDGAGGNRAERKSAVYYHLNCFPAAIPLKLADRIANVRSCIKTGDKRLGMYRREYREFRENLWRNETGTAAMWGELEDLLVRG